MEESHLDKYFYMKEPDLLAAWLDHSKAQPSTMQKPTMDESIVAFIYHCCDDLELKKEVAFMAVELTAKYLEIHDVNCATSNNDCILSMMAIIVISNNLVGFRPNLPKTKVVHVLQSFGLLMYDVAAVNKAEMDVALRFEFKFPLTTMLDDVHALVGMFLKAPIIIDKMQKQCEHLLNVFYLNCKVITESLDEYYAMKNRNETLQRCYETRLFFPAGIYLTALRIHKKSRMYDDNAIGEHVAEYVKIGQNDFWVFQSVFINVLCLSIVSNDD